MPSFEVDTKGHPELKGMLLTAMDIDVTPASPPAIYQDRHLESRATGEIITISAASVPLIRAVTKVLSEYVKSRAANVRLRRADGSEWTISGPYSADDIERIIGSDGDTEHVHPEAKKQTDS